MKDSVNFDQISPTTYYKVNFPVSSYSQMIIEDISMYYSLFSDNFYRIEPNDEMLEKLVGYDIEYFLNHNIKDMIELMFEKGKVFFEIVIIKDENDEIRLILKPIYELVDIPIFSKTIFISKDLYQGIELFSIPNIKLLKLDINDLDISYRKLKRMFKKLKKMEDHIVSNSIFQKNNQININKRFELLEYLLLKYTKGLFWNGRQKNKLINDNYYLYREEKFFQLRRRILDYILGKINNTISIISTVYPINGRVKYNDDFGKIKNVYKDYCDKKMNINDSYNRIKKY